MNENKSKFEIDLEANIKHHNHMRIVNCYTYVGLTISFVIFGGAATIYASQDGYGIMAAWFAAISTASGTLERSLRLRERWLDHLRRLTQLRNIKIKIENEIVDVPGAIKLYETEVIDYAKNIPMEGRNEI